MKKISLVVMLFGALAVSAQQTPDASESREPRSPRGAGKLCRPQLCRLCHPGSDPEK